MGIYCFKKKNKIKKSQAQSQTDKNDSGKWDKENKKEKAASAAERVYETNEKQNNKKAKKKDLDSISNSKRSSQKLGDEDIRTHSDEEKKSRQSFSHDKQLTRRQSPTTQNLARIIASAKKSKTIPNQEPMLVIKLINSDENEKSQVDSKPKKSHVLNESDRDKLKSPTSGPTENLARIVSSARKTRIDTKNSEPLYSTRPRINSNKDDKVVQTDELDYEFMVQKLKETQHPSNNKTSQDLRFDRESLPHLDKSNQIDRLDEAYLLKHLNEASSKRQNNHKPFQVNKIMNYKKEESDLATKYSRPNSSDQIGEKQKYDDPFPSEKYWISSERERESISKVEKNYNERANQEETARKTRSTPKEIVRRFKRRVYPQKKKRINKLWRY